MTQGAGGECLRLLVVNWQDRANPQAGGAEIHLHEIFGRLARRGHDVTLLASGWPGCEPTAELDGIRVHRTGGRHTFSVAAPLYFRRHLTATPFDVVVEDLNKVPLFTPCWTHTPIALLVHHLFGETAFREASVPVASVTWLLERLVPRTFSGIPTVAVSESTRQDLIHRGLAGDDVSVIPNGVDTEELTPSPDNSLFEQPTVLYFGRLKRYKGVDHVLRAVAELRRRGVPARLLIGGKGDDMPRLQALADALGVHDATEFLGFVPDADKLALLRKSWVHVLASPKEGWGITNIEAAACGTPTVASDAPGLRESVRDGETGFLVPHGDTARLADRIGEILTDAALRDKLGKGARRFAETLTWEASADAMEAFLRLVRTQARG